MGNIPDKHFVAEEQQTRNSNNNRNSNALKTKQSNFTNQLKIMPVQIVSGTKILYEKAKPMIIKNKKAVIIIATSVVVILFVMIAAGLYSSDRSASKQNLRDGSVNSPALPPAPTNPIHDQLNDISAKLANIEQGLSHEHAYVDIDQIRKLLAGLQFQVNQLANHSNQIITQQIETSTTQLQGELNSIKTELATVTAQKAHPHLLNPSLLPFKVMSIDNIQESDVVTISYDHHILPIDVGESLAGWTLVNASSVDQKAQFKRGNEDYVSIDLNELNQHDRKKVVPSSQ